MSGYNKPVWLLAILIIVLPASADSRLDSWLAFQAGIQTWYSGVTQIRTIKNLTRPLSNEGELWFIKPNQFRWQLGSPVRTLAIRDNEQLLVVYPRLKQAERYPFNKIEDPAMKQALLLLEVGFPSEAAAFYEQYELIDEKAIAEQQAETAIFTMQPKQRSARQLLEKLTLEINKDLSLSATELFFKDGSSLRNVFHHQRYNIEIKSDKLKQDLSGFELVEPMATY